MNMEPMIEAANATSPMTLQDVRDLIQSSPTLAGTYKRDLLSALTCFGKWVGLPLDQTIASQRVVAEFFEALSYGGVGVTKRRFENVRSGVSTAIRFAQNPQPAKRTPIAETWTAIVDRSQLQSDRTCVRKFARFCTKRSVEPEDVTDQISQTYLYELEQGSMVRKPREKHQALCRAWNRLVADSGSNQLQVLEVPKYADRYGHSQAAFPVSLQAEIESYRRYLTNEDPLAEKAPNKPLRPTSADQRVKQLYSAASVLVHCSVPIERVDRLSVLVDVANFKSILRFHVDRQSGQKTKMLSDVAQGLFKVALRFLEVSADQLDELRDLKKRVKVEMNSMTDKNRKVLQPFNDPILVQRFKELPLGILAKLKRQPLTNKNAILGQKAIAILILMYAPMRLKNLAGLDMTRHLNWTISPGKLSMEIPAHEVKNEELLVFELPTEAAQWVKHYINNWRPLLLRGANPHLFPGEQGQPKSSNNLSQQIAALTFARLGVRLTAHQFRHLMGKLFLDRNPGQYEVLRRVLAHRSIQTTMDYYAGEEARSAVKHYQENVFGHLEVPSQPPRSRASK